MDNQKGKGQASHIRPAQMTQQLAKQSVSLDLRQSVRSFKHAASNALLSQVRNIIHFLNQGKVMATCNCSKFLNRTFATINEVVIGIDYDAVLAICDQLAHPKWMSISRRRSCALTTRRSCRTFLLSKTDENSGFRMKMCIWTKQTNVTGDNAH